MIFARALSIVGLTLLSTLPVFAQDVSNWDLEDSEWLKESADALATCVGSYRGAAHLMRLGNQEATADYIEDTARGAYVASMFLLTIRAGLQDKILYQEDSAKYIDALAHAKESQFEMIIESAADKDRSNYIEESLQICADLNELQTFVVQAMREAATLEADNE